MSKPRLVLISDIFGISNDLWMNEYRDQLSPHFQLVEYDSRVLAKIDVNHQKLVHGEFINGGIDAAVQNLLKLEPNGSTILGFSVGGTIAWKYALEKKSENVLHLVSATRLRNETQQPPANLNLYFGEFETNGPNKTWFENFNLRPTIFELEDHDCYKSSFPIKRITSEILSRTS